MPLQIDYKVEVDHKTQQARKLAGNLVDDLITRGDPMPVVESRINPDDPTKSIWTVITLVRDLTGDKLTEIVRQACRGHGVEKK